MIRINHQTLQQLPDHTLLLLVQDGRESYAVKDSVACGTGRVVLRSLNGGFNGSLGMGEISEEAEGAVDMGQVYCYALQYEEIVQMMFSLARAGGVLGDVRCVLESSNTRPLVA